MEGDRTNTNSPDDINNATQRSQPLHGRTRGPTRRSTKGQWTPEEDEILHQAVQRFKGKNWKKIAECFKDRTDVQCLHRWQKVLNPELVKGPWSKEEDEVIIQLVNEYGPKKWSTIAQHLPGRIGKQCRERWHNHLNPTINREAWTQEEELALIRAHQVYGNKWAELTKFLPGRSDNAIKNHWNSSVKKKLDQYLASGLLQQFQGLPHVSQSNQSYASSSSKVQQSSSDDVPKERAELEEVSQCSQGSTVVGCSQSTSDMGNAVVHSKVESRVAEESSDRKDQSSNTATCSENYLTGFQEAAYPDPDVPHELGASSVYIENNSAHDWETSRANAVVHSKVESRIAGESSNKKDQSSNTATCSENCLTGFQEAAFPDPDVPHELGASSVYVENNSAHVWETSGANDWQLNSFGSSKVTSQDPGQESSEQFMQYLNDSDDQQIPLQDQLGFDNAIYVDEGFPSEININGVDGAADPLLFQSNYYSCEDDHLASQSGYYSSSTDMLATSYSQQPSLPQQLLYNDGSLIFGIDPNQFNSSFIANPEQDILPERCDGFNWVNKSDKYPCDDRTETQTPQSNNASALVMINDLGSVPSADIQTPAEKMQLGHDNQKDFGALCYEPPRFSSLESPFLSCDLIQFGKDMPEYSPLGTRQLFSPSNRMWDSPSSDKSPEALLKSAAKSYTCTPSIMKKRNRDLVSPLSEKRSVRKFEIDPKQKPFSNLSKGFSRVGVMFDDAGNDRALEMSPSSNENRNTRNFIEDKENINPHHGQGSDGKFLPEDKLKQQISVVDYGAEDEAHADIVNQACGTLIEHDMNSMVYFSPDPFGVKSERTIGLSTVLNKYARRLEAASNVASSSSETPFLSVCSPHVSDKKDGNSSVPTRSLYSDFSSTPEVNKIGTSRIDAGVENISPFGVTPFKSSFESPSGWKSPWFPDSLLGSRGDADMTLEEIEKCLSPGDQSYDAIGWMKQLGEQTATAFANAQEVLGDETPQTILKKRRSTNQEADKEISRCQHEQRSVLSSSFMAERRMLDFSDCGTPEKGVEAGKVTKPMSFSSERGRTPGKGVETGKVTKALSFSSPSSYLMKGCR